MEEGCEGFNCGQPYLDQMSENSNAIGALPYVDTAVLEALAKHFLHRTFMLLLNDPRRGGEYPERAFTHPRVVGLTGLEQSCEKFHPHFA
jgi:hypothetical protein